MAGNSQQISFLSITHSLFPSACSLNTSDTTPHRSSFCPCSPHLLSLLSAQHMEVPLALGAAAPRSMTPRCSFQIAPQQSLAPGRKQNAGLDVAAGRDHPCYHTDLRLTLANSRAWSVPVCAHQELSKASLIYKHGAG